MRTEYKLNPDVVEEVIREAERRHGFTLCMEDFTFLSGSLISFVHNAADKFVCGAMEHQDNSPFVQEVDHMACMKEEAIDQWMYVTGEIRKRKEGKVWTTKPQSQVKESHDGSIAPSSSPVSAIDPAK